MSCQFSACSLCSLRGGAATCPEQVDDLKSGTDMIRYEIVQAQIGPCRPRRRASL